MKLLGCSFYFMYDLLCYLVAYLMSAILCLFVKSADSVADPCYRLCMSWLIRC